MGKIKSKLRVIRKLKYYDLFVIILSVLTIAGIIFMLIHFKPEGEGIAALGIALMGIIAIFVFALLMRKIVFMIDRKFKEDDKK